MRYPEKNLTAILARPPLLALLLLMLAIQGCGGRGGIGEPCRYYRRAGASALEGRWVIDADATAEHAGTSPRWREENENNLSRMLEMLSGRYSVVIGPGSILIEARGYRADVPVVLAESSGNTRVYRGAAKGSEVEFAITLDENGNMSLRSSMFDDFEYIVWRKSD